MVSIELEDNQVERIVVDQLKDDLKMLRDPAYEPQNPIDKACNDRIIAALNTLLNEWYNGEG